MSVLSLAVVAAIVLKVIDWLKQIQNRQYNAALTQLAVWVVGAGVILICAQSQIAGGLILFGVAVKTLSFWDAVLVGLAMGSSASIGWQTIANLGGGSNEVATPLFPKAKALEVRARTGANKPPG